MTRPFQWRRAGSLRPQLNLCRVSFMATARRPSVQTMMLLDALADRPDQWRYGYELVSQLGVSSGSLYPILMRLADRGLLEAVWETDGRPGRPPRHLYRLTPSGLDFVGQLAATPAPPPRRTRLQGA
jgi:PadR family transcriptional regulator PadR